VLAGGGLVLALTLPPLTAGPLLCVLSLGLLVATLFQRALERARRLEVVLAARGYVGELRVLANTGPRHSRSPSQGRTSIPPTPGAPCHSREG
jgi:hypothetical protein